MAFSDPAFEKRRAALGGGIGTQTTQNSNSGSSFVDPVFEKRRQQIITSPQPVKKQTTAPVTIQQPKQQNLVDRTTSNLSWAGNTALDNATSMVKKIGNMAVKLVTPKQTELDVQVQKLTQTPLKLMPGQKKLDQSQMQQISAGSATMKSQSKEESLKKAQEIMKATSEKINAIEKVFDSQTVKPRALKKGYIEPGIMGSMVEEISQGTISTLGNIGAGTEMVGRQMKANPYDIKSIAAKFLLTNVGRKISAEADNVIANNPEWMADPKEGWTARKIARLGAGAVPSILINIAATLVTAPFGGVGGYATGYLMEGGATYKEAKKMGVSEEKAQFYGTTVGIVNSIFEHIMPGSISFGKKAGKEVIKEVSKEATKKISTSLAKDALKNLGKFGLKLAEKGALEGSTEGIQEMWSNIIATNYDKNRKVWDNVVESIVGGFVGGGVFGGGTEQVTEQMNVMPDGTYTPEQVIGKIIQGKLDQTTEGKELLKTALQAKETGQELEVKNEAIVDSKQETINQETKTDEYKSGSIKELQDEMDRILNIDPNIKGFKKRQTEWGISYLATQQAADLGDQQAIKDIDRLVELQSKIEDLRDLRQKTFKDKKQAKERKQTAKEYVENKVKNRTNKFRESQEVRDIKMNEGTDLMQAIESNIDVVANAEKNKFAIDDFAELTDIANKLARNKETQADKLTAYEILQRNGIDVGQQVAKANISPKFREAPDTSKQLEELLAVKQPNLEQIKLINKLRGEQMAQKQAKSAEDIGEEQMGWKDGQKDEFDNAVSMKNAEKVREMLPGIPAYYKEEFKSKIDEALGNGPKFREDPLYAEARKYKDVEEFIQSQGNFRDGHAAPSFDDTPVNQRMEDGGDFSLAEVVKGQHTQPADYFDPKVGPKYYMYEDKAGMESLTAINNVKRGAKTITAYRAIPKEISVDKLIDGDWITFSKTYAENHGLSRFGENEYKIIKQKVNPKEVWWDGNDIREWGYDTGKTTRLSRYDLMSIWNKANLKYRLKDDFEKATGIKITNEQEKKIKDLNNTFFKDDDVRITYQIIANKKALGQYYQNMIDILDGQADPVATYLHEAVHKYLDVFATTEEYVAILEEGAKKYKTDDYAQVEENIAEDFILYARNATESKLSTETKGLFKKIIERIKIYFGNKSAIERLYGDILEGKAAKKAQKTGQEQATQMKSDIPVNEEAQTPVGKGDKAKSKAYTRVYDRLAEETKQDVSYNKLNLEKDVDAAAEFAATDPKAALRVALGLEEAPAGQTETAISILLADKAGRDGDFALQSQLESARSLRQTRRGQEIVSERGRFNEDSPHYFIRKVLDERLNNIGKSLGVAIEEYRLKLVTAKEVAIKKIDKAKKAIKSKIEQKIKEDSNKINFAKDFLSSITCK